MDEIRKELTSLKCIVCNNYLSVPPIYYTPSGEYRCGRCSFVKENMSFRADLYEKMAHCVTFPCIYQDCDAEISWNDVPDHEAVCSKRMIECPFDCDARVNMKELVQHFNLVHESLKLSKKNLANESVLNDGEQVKLFYIVGEGEPFVVMFIPGNGEFKFGSIAAPNTDDSTTFQSTTTSVSRYTVKPKKLCTKVCSPTSTTITTLTTTNPSCDNTFLLSSGTAPTFRPNFSFMKTPLFSVSPPTKTTTTFNFGSLKKSSAVDPPRTIGIEPPSLVFPVTLTSKTTTTAPNFESSTISSSASLVTVPKGTTYSSQPTSSSFPKQTPSIFKQSGLSVFSLFPSKPFTSFTLTFISNSWKADIKDQRVEPFISKEHCRKCWFNTCKNKLHIPYSTHINLNEHVIAKFKSSALSKLFECDDVEFSITVHNKPIVEAEEKGPYVELSRTIQHTLECPICTHTMVPPISVCATGHAICTTCKLFLIECPTCKAAYTGTRSFALEELYETCRLMCSSSNNKDCDFVGNVDEINNHDKCHEAE